jgi:FKBP-type peptidyl-prolyl cis-trans isomerase 2
MKKEQNNKKAAIFLQGKLENGEIFEETPPDHPVVIALGQNAFFPVIEKELYTMKPGETRTFTLTAEQAYGPHHEHLVQKIDRSVFGDRIDPQPGMILSLNLESSHGPEKVPALVISASSDQVTVDYNHPLAGKQVTYIVTLQEWIK